MNEDFYLTDLMPSVVSQITDSYEHIQTPEFDVLIHDYLKDAVSVENPTLIQISGIPGSGKTTFSKQAIFEPYLYLNCDTVMERIPAYNQQLFLNGSEQAFAQWEMPARIIGYQILLKAIKRRINILFEHSGGNQAHIELFQNIKKLGYSTELIFLDCDREVAYKRIQERMLRTHRFTPRHLVDERADVAKAFLKKYQQIADKVTVLDTTEGVPSYHAEERSVND